MKPETIARLIFIAMLVAVPSTILISRGLPAWSAAQAHEEVIDLHASMPEQGGWSLSSISVHAGQTLRLRLTSDDVMHSFAIGQSSQPPVDLKPGEVQQVTLKFDTPGIYTYYCTRWCGPNHWRMRGTIEVLPAEGQANGAITQSASQPLYARLGLNLDEAPPSLAGPDLKPSAVRGASLGISLPQELAAPEYYQTHSPADLWQALHSQPLGKQLSSQQTWDLVAWAWQEQSSPETIAEGQKLFAQNCASCHGEQGAGNGVFASAVQPTPATPGQGMAGMPSGSAEGSMGHEAVPPANFTNPAMLAQNPARWQGKILRGGMGTGMPYWGPIFTDAQTWALVDYLWTFSMEYTHEKK